MICSCSSNDFFGEQVNSQVLTNIDQRESPEKSTLENNAEQSQLEDMVLFEGSVFVASTKPITSRWELAGWRIASIAEAVKGEKVPLDCTLYPHEGVEDQWIGSCAGSTFIPTNGANHIAVMHTRLDGKTTLVQVAPSAD
jgi:hypothetical protein